MKRDVSCSSSSASDQKPCHHTSDAAPRVWSDRLQAFLLGTRPKTTGGTGRCRLYPIADAILKIGRYIAITINPIIVPKNTIIAGSSSAVSDVTA